MLRFPNHISHDSGLRFESERAKGAEKASAEKRSSKKSPHFLGECDKILDLLALRFALTTSARHTSSRGGEKRRTLQKKTPFWTTVSPARRLLCSFGAPLLSLSSEELKKAVAVSEEKIQQRSRRRGLIREEVKRP